jgi:hypothetical protein
MAAVTDDPEQLRALARPADRNLTVTAGGRFTASLTRINLARIWMQTGKQSLPFIFENGLNGERHVITFHMTAGTDIVSQGVSISLSDIAVTNAPHLGLCQQLPGGVQWRACRFPWTRGAN